MDCNRMKEIILTDYIDGRLNARELKDVEAHLASCKPCRAAASELLSLRAEFGKSRREEPPSEVWERIRSEVERTPAATVFSQDFFRSLRPVFARLRPAITVAAAATLILIVLMVGRLMPPRGAINAPVGEDEILSIAALEENGSADYDFGTPEESYFL